MLVKLTSLGKASLRHLFYRRYEKDILSTSIWRDFSWCSGAQRRLALGAMTDPKAQG